ncbi:hypothetical protein [Modestobacter sp. VKM Ac-2985]|uniref:hypothetical protein n=1 Tax=Modestobacter sp. VKM Ac-2985 TaxID=3004139 RepID=UPI0022AB56E4|nr:hypothetical protein [Modestobacter sp. VKM Ac-2985]MCZ2837185.1 hypothetical protein [Modestobacter sp. VKM Ac-2985]
MPQLNQRTVRFFEITGPNLERLPKDLPFEPMLDAVNDVDDDNAYVQLGNSMELLGSVYRPTPGANPVVPLLALDRITRDVRLRIERRRNYRPLQLLEDETLAEPSFFSIFPRNVLAILRNSGSAPGVASFRDYINKLDILDGEIGITPLVDKNALRALQDVDTLTRLTVAVGADADPDDFEGSPMVRSVLRDARQRLGAVAFEFTVKLSPKGQHDASEAAIEEIRQLASNPESLLSATKAQIAYRRIENGRAATYDFVNEAVTQAADVELEAETAQPTERSASEAIAKAYNTDKYDDILSALALSE